MSEVFEIEIFEKYIVWNDIFFGEWFSLEERNENIFAFKKLINDCSFYNTVVIAKSCLDAIQKVKNNKKREICS